ncbi:hypothetical protein Aduo_016593 [Ancylostoma duodenale]
MGMNGRTCGGGGNVCRSLYTQSVSRPTGDDCACSTGSLAAEDCGANWAITDRPIVVETTDRGKTPQRGGLTQADPQRLDDVDQ